MTTTSNLHLQLEPGELVLDGEAESRRVIAYVGVDGHLRIHREHWSLSNPSYPDGCWHHDHDWGGALSPEATQKLVELLAPTTEQLDVYRTRCQQLANRVQELERGSGYVPNKSDRDTLARICMIAPSIHVGDLMRRLCQRLLASSCSVGDVGCMAGKMCTNACGDMLPRNEESAVRLLDPLLETVHADLVAERDRLRRSLTQLIARVRSVGGYATPEEQDVLREAERVCGGAG